MTATAMTVLLPNVEAIPEALRGTPFTVRELLGDGDSNTKLAKSQGRGYLTYGLSLAPAKSSGYQVCASASPGCEGTCLAWQGRAMIWDNITLSRVAKTVAFFTEREWFLAKLDKELNSAGRKGAALGQRVCVRLNVLSDIMWPKVAPWLFTKHPDIQFYGYTKHVRLMLDWCDGKLPPNDHLTFSRSETNDFECETVLGAGGSVAVVFDKHLSRQWKGRRVFNGDETDLRFLDPKNAVIGLKAKGAARHNHTGFVVHGKLSLINRKGV